MELTIPKEKNVETDLGKFYYTPSLLEAFCEELAKKWEVHLPRLIPESGFNELITGFILSRQIGDREKRVRVSYFKYGTDKLARSIPPLTDPDEKKKALARVLYKTSEPDHESVILVQGNKHVDIHFEPEGKKEVTFVDEMALKALRQVERDGDLPYLVQKTEGATMNFHNTAGRFPRIPFEITDMQGAINVARAYFELEPNENLTKGLVKVADPNAD
jgi:hypothetical protein